MTLVMTSTELDKALSFCERRHWVAELVTITKNRPAGPKTIKGEPYIPLENDTSEIPDKALRRKDEFKQQWPKTIWYVGHPQPKFLIGSGEAISVVENEWREIINGIGVMLFAGLFVLAIVASVVVLLVGLALILLPVFIGLAMAALVPIAIVAMMVCGVDPWLVAVIEVDEGFAWIDICRWSEENENNTSDR